MVIVLKNGGSVDKFNHWLTYSIRTSDGWELSDDFDENDPITGVGSDYNEDGGTREELCTVKLYTAMSLNLEQPISNRPNPFRAGQVTTRIMSGRSR